METTTENKVGYKKTKLGWIPEDWTIKSLDNVSQFRNGKGHENIVDDNGKYILVNSKFVSTSGEVKKYVTNCLVPLSKGEITMVMSDVPNGKAIAKCFFIDENDKYSLNQRIGAIKAHKDIDSIFLFYQLNRNKYYLRFDDGVKQTNLRKDEVLGCPLAIPPFEEQQKIATILSTWDKAIEKLTQLIAAKEQRKKGLMQLLLTGKKRFVGFTEEWKEVKLGKVTKSFSGGTPTSTNADYYNGSIPFIGSGELNQGLVKKTNKHITEEGLKNSSAKIVEPHTLLIAMYGATAGVCAITEISGAINQAVLAVIPNKSVDKQFLYYRLVQQMPNVVFRMVQGGQPNLSGSILKSVKISFPEISEQQKIASTLSAADKEIELLKQELSNLQQQKKGLMQKLLTGEVRVKKIMAHAQT